MQEKQQKSPKTFELHIRTENEKESKKPEVNI